MGTLRSLVTPVAVVGLALGAVSADARMYQWMSPSTGSLQMSGEPPPWYRSQGDGPRVYVFEDGFLVDDTAIDVSDARKRALRRNAFAELSERRTLEALARVRAGTATDEDRVLAEKSAEPVEVPDTVLAAAADNPAAGKPTDDKPTDDKPAGGLLPDNLDSDAIERLKKIIADFDRGGGRR